VTKFKFLREKTFREEIHRAGWNWVTKSLVKKFHDEKADILIDEFIERTFDWDYTFNNDKPQVLPHHKQDWIGFIHNPIIIPKPFDIKQSPVNMCARIPFLLALQNCKGMFTLSDDLEESVRHLFIQYGYDHIPIETLLHPTPLNVDEFKLNEFLKDPQITCIGYWLRNFEPYWLLDTEMPKNVLLGRLPYAHQIYNQQKTQFDLKCKFTGEKVKGDLIVHKHLENKEFDKFLTTTVAFLNLIDTSANNGVTDCLARNIPLLVNCHPAVVQYLGDDYPFYYNSLETANRKINDIKLIKKTYNYLKNMNKTRVNIRTFMKEFEQSNIYKGLQN
tara:strand:+ start:1658 stop:2653 length:996 start_codon:yes stop_codon:yes gene_type:complete